MPLQWLNWNMGCFHRGAPLSQAGGRLEEEWWSKDQRVPVGAHQTNSVIRSQSSISQLWAYFL